MPPSRFLRGRIAAIPAVGVLALHFLFVSLGQRLFPGVVWDLFLVVPLFFLSARDIVPLWLPLGLLSVVFNLLAEPALGFAPAVWFSILPMLFIVRRETSVWKLAAIGWWIGTLLSMGVFSWLLPTLGVFFDFGAVARGGVFLIASAVLGMQFALFFALTGLLHRGAILPLGLVGALVHTLIEFWMPFPFPLYYGLAFSWHPLFIQIADLAGMAGVTFAVVLVGGSLFEGVQSVRSCRWGRAAGWELAGMLVVVFQVGYGFLKIRSIESSQADLQEVQVALIQPMSPLKVMNADTETKLKAASQLIALSSQAVSASPDLPDLLIWPEGAGPFSYRSPKFNPEYLEALTPFLQSTRIPLLVQDIEFTRLPGDSKPRYYSTITLIDASGAVQDSYRKNLLLPFAEYLPGREWFPGLATLFAESRSILPGEEGKPLQAPWGPMVPLICYEVLFPDYVRTLCQQGGRWMVNLTNDRWYGDSQQPIQHLAFSVFRAVENRLPMVRCTNSGISALVEPTGAILEGRRTEAMEPTFLRGGIRLSPGGSFYASYGDVLPRWILSPLFLFLLPVCLMKAKPHQDPKKI